MTLFLNKGEGRRLAFEAEGLVSAKALRQERAIGLMPLFPANLVHEEMTEVEF